MVLQASAAAIVPLLSTAACGRESPSEDEGPVYVSEADVRVLGTSDQLSQVLDLEVLPSGAVWVLNSVEPFFVGFDAQGRALPTHGAEGGGPEEFRMPAAFMTGGWEDEAWVLDFLRHDLVRVSRPDAWAEISIPQQDIPAGSLRGGMSLMSATVRTARIDHEVIVARADVSLEGGLTAFRLGILGADLVALDLETGSVRTIVSLAEVLANPAEGFVATEGGFPLWYRLWAVCGDDQIRVYDRVRNELRGFSSDGTELASVQLPAPQWTEVTPREFAGVIFPLREAEITGGVGSRLSSQDSLRIVNEIVQGVQGQPSELASYLPRYVDFRCSDDGVMWMQPLDLEVGGLSGGALWLRITPDGVIQEVHFPVRFDAMRFSPRRVWGVQRDELDLASVAWIELPNALTRQ